MLHVVMHHSDDHNTKSVHELITAAEAKTKFENLMFSEPSAINEDDDLFAELMQHLQSIDSKHKTLGIVLVSQNQSCKLCNAPLIIKADRPSYLTILYSDRRGTIPGTHYRKICKNFCSGCSFVQHYSHYSKGGDKIIFDDDWKLLEYFVSTRETAFEMKLLEQLDVELLIGQQSYKQCSDIYNYRHTVLTKKGKISTALQ